MENIVVTRSRRKTLAIYIRDPGIVEVRSPKHLSEKEIYSFLNTKKDWIEKKLHIVNERSKQKAERHFNEGALFLFQGRSYPLIIKEKQDVPLLFDNGFYLSEYCRECTRDVFINWYKQRAREYILERAGFYSQFLGIAVKNLRISNAQKRWGSCTSQGNVSFSWRLIMAPVQVIDYVIIHELCHIIEHNHSDRFWQKVAVTMPEYKTHKKWLKENGFRLNV